MMETEFMPFSEIITRLVQTLGININELAEKTMTDPISFIR